MILYHGSNTEIVEIDLSKCYKYKDFPILEPASLFFHPSGNKQFHNKRLAGEI